jgi:GNAT superfamily N-acetyltransferase
MLPEIIATDEPDLSARDAIGRGLEGFNEARNGPGEFRRLALLLRNPATSEIVGGLWGWTYRHWLTVELLFVPEALRGTGLGSELMRLAEAEAIRRGCRGAWLDTFSFQARGFYERLGYAVFGEIADCPPGHSRLFLSKTLADPN